VLIDDTMKPWLLEVNVCPSLSSTSPLDTKIKHTLLTDTFNLIGVQPPLKGSTQMPKEIFSRNIRQLADLDYSNCVDRLNVQDWNILF
jgi:tubulin polyglutamylase TTLL4